MAGKAGTTKGLAKMASMKKTKGKGGTVKGRNGLEKLVKSCNEEVSSAQLSWANHDTCE